MDKKLKDRLRKLKNVMDDPAATEGEVTAASAMFTKLLMKHNLDETAVNLSVVDVTELHIETDGNKNEGSFEATLIHIIANGNLCSAFITSYGKHKYQGNLTVVGTEDNIEAVIEQFKMLRVKFREIAKQETKKAKQEAGGKFNPNKYKRDFYRGVAVGLKDKYDSLQSDYGTESGAYGLMVTKHNEIIDDYNQAKHPDLQSNRSKRTRVGSGFEKGQQVGNRTTTQAALN